MKHQAQIVLIAMLVLSIYQVSDLILKMRTYYRLRPVMQPESVEYCKPFVFLLDKIQSD